MPNVRLGRGLDILLPQKGVISQAPSGMLEVGIEDISVSAHQARRKFNQEELASLAESIKTYGVLEPVLLSEKPTSGYTLLAGERRWRAAKLAGLKTLPAIIKNVGKKEAQFIGLIENVQRKDLNPLELAQAVQGLAAQFNLTHDEMAVSLGFSRPRVSNLLRLLDLADEIKEYVMAGHLSESQARSLLAINDEEERISLARKIALEDKRISVRELERHRLPAKKDANIADAEEKLSQALKTNVRIAHSAKKQSGWISIRYENLEHFENLYKRLSN